MNDEVKKLKMELQIAELKRQAAELERDDIAHQAKINNLKVSALIQDATLKISKKAKEEKL